MLPTLILPLSFEIQRYASVPWAESNGIMQLSDVPDTPTPVSRVTFVSDDPSSYVDDFSYIAAIPSSIFYAGGTKYISPLLYTGGTDSENWLLEDWKAYLSPDNGISEVITIGDMPFSEIREIQDLTETKVYPQIKGATSAEVAAKIALNDWRYADTVVLALAKDSFANPTTSSGSASYTFNGASISSYQVAATVSSTTETGITFTPPAGVGWMEGAFNWTGSEIFTHRLEDPLGRPVDYSVYRQVIFERNTGLGYIDRPLPLYFWYPITTAGEWTMIMKPQSQITRDIAINGFLTYYPGFSETINVPDRAKWLNISATWDNAGTTLNFALIDPTGRLIMWSPAESIFGGAGFKSMQMPYPMSGAWTIVGAWVDPTAETNNVNIEWDVETLPADLQPTLESAANGAVLASLLNAPLLYVYNDAVPSITTWALEQLGATTLIFVDPANYHAQSVVDELNDSFFVSVMSSYAAVTNMIHTLSGEMDVVLTVPLGRGNELFAPAAYSAASHGASIYSLCGSDNLVTTRAEETWAPYQIGPDIEIFVVAQFTTRAENGWYDERIPNKYSMQYSASSTKSFLDTRGAFHESMTQSAIIISPPDLVKVSFDRSLQSHFASGRIPTKDVRIAAAMINRAALHRFLFRTSDNADTALLTLYAYTLNSTPYVDNFGETHIIQQISGTVGPLEDAGFTISPHVGVNEVYGGIASQVAFWSLSTHGTLTESPTDPPQRPNGPGVFSLRDEDIPYGQEQEGVLDIDGKGLVNPVVYEPESNHHIIRNTQDLEQSIGNIGSPIVVVTACLLGGSELPIMLMEHGAVAVVASPRTVYFRAAGLLSILFTESLGEGNTTGDSLAYAVTAISYDYTNPQSGDPNDYGNQQVLFGDPDIVLYNPSTHPRISAVNPSALDLSGHIPGRGVTSVAALGRSNYLPDGFASLSVEFDYYESANFSDFLKLLDLRKTVVIEPSALTYLSDDLVANAEPLSEFIYNGGVIVIVGASQDISWLPWDIKFQSEATSAFVLLDPGHPLVSIPNAISTSVNSNGHLVGVPSNMSVIAMDSGGPVIIASTYGNGKIAITTTVPTGSDRDAFLENIVSWNAQDSLVLWDAFKSQEIIWEGDRVWITFVITDIAGIPVSNVSISVSVNSTQLDAQEVEAGHYHVLVDEAWTSANQGFHSIEITAMKTGYDSLSILLVDYLFIRISPLPMLAVGGGIIVVTIVAWQYRKRKYGDSKPSTYKPKRSMKPETREERRRRKLEEKERRRKREEEERRFDAKEFFGV